jgi:hypothetical protein
MFDVTVISQARISVQMQFGLVEPGVYHFNVYDVSGKLVKTTNFNGRERTNHVI